jgi:hypothetical protein
MSNLGNAYALASGLYARDRSEPLADIADKIYHMVDVLDFGQDERKAHLYAQLADRLTPDLQFADAVLTVERAMDNTDWDFPPEVYCA